MLFMVVDTVFECERLGYSVVGISPSCSRVTQSPRAISDRTDTGGQRKYRNKNPARQTEPNITAESPDSMTTQRKTLEGGGEVSARVESEGPSTLGVKRKALQKLASGAIANIGSVLRGGSNEQQLEGYTDTSPGKASRATRSSGSNDAYDNTLDSDPGTQDKLLQKERFFGKAWRNRPKVIPNAGNSLWIPEVWCSLISGCTYYRCALCTIKRKRG